MERRFTFKTAESSEYFAEEAGMSIRFDNLSVYVEPIFGEPYASVAIECHTDDISVATAEEIALAFNELYASRKWRRIAAIA